MHKVDDIVLSLGSNLGDRKANLQTALKLLEESYIIEINKISPIYETEPKGFKEQNNFLNLCVCCRSQHGINELLGLIKSVEHYIGRLVRGRWQEREIDIDIIFFHDMIINTPNIIIPHARMHERRFVLQPLCDILPDGIHPLLNKTIKQLLHDCGDNSEVKLLN